MATSSIEWTQSTWNPTTGCNKISPGCKHCYAERMSERLLSMGIPKYENGFSLRLHEDVLPAPLTWKKPQIIFVNSMSDMFHEDIPFEFLEKVFLVMGKAYWHQFQVLTKRAEHLAEIAPKLNWPNNVWMGVSVESKDYKYRINLLQETPAQIKFLSLEPLLGDLGILNLSGIDWVIVGGESGPGARPMKKEWVLNVRDQCKSAHIPFFFKQWGGVQKNKTGRVLDGKLWDEMPKYNLLNSPQLARSLL